jgi:hypothetical protein
LLKLKENKINEKELKKILREERYFLIRNDKFLNDLMENDENYKVSQKKRETELRK